MVGLMASLVQFAVTVDWTIARLSGSGLTVQVPSTLDFVDGALCCGSEATVVFCAAVLCVAVPS